MWINLAVYVCAGVSVCVCAARGQCCGSSLSARQRNPVVRHPTSILSKTRPDWPQPGNLPAHRPALYGNRPFGVMGTRQLV